MDVQLAPALPDGKRAESGNMKFGDDWTGLFIRGDNAFYFAMHLRAILEDTTDPKLFLSKKVIEGLLDDLEKTNEFSA